MEGNLKRVTLEISFDQLRELELDYLEPGIEEMVILDGLKISSEVCVNIWKFPINFDPEGVRKRLGIIETSQINRSEKETICLVKKPPSKLTLLLEKFNLYYEFPLYINRKRSEISIRGLARDIDLLFSALHKLGINYRVKKAADYITPGDILSILTKKQREALTLALKDGYFKTPRKTDAHALAKKLGIRHTTFLQHLRRAQEKIFEMMVTHAP